MTKGHCKLSSILHDVNLTDELVLRLSVFLMNFPIRKQDLTSQKTAAKETKIYLD